MHKVLKISYLEFLEDVFRKMTLSEKLLMFLFATLLFVGVAGTLFKIASYATTEVPISGGSLTEAVVGTPRFINPLLSLTDSDRDLVMLTYSGLMRASSEGKLVPDLAKSYKISDDGKEYTFTLRDNAYFHDGEPVTADDVLFTISMAQDPILKSVKRANWDGVTVEKIDDKTILFKLPEPYSPFIENATLGILPKHLWESMDPSEFSYSNLNIKPTGSGPYMIHKIFYDKSGIPEKYVLKPFKKHVLGAPKIKKLTLLFVRDKEDATDALAEGVVDAISGISVTNNNNKEIPKYLNTITYPRIFALFFNQDKKKVFADKSVRKALDTTIDKRFIVDSVFGGYADTLSSAIPPSMLDGSEQNNFAKTKEERLNEAKKILKSGKWKFGNPNETKEENGVVNDDTGKVWYKKDQILEFTISTANTPELNKVAQILADSWRELGIKVNIEAFNTNELNQNVIRTREYDSLLFGEVVGRSLDLFAFWHSSQRDDPGLNVAMYANPKMDKLLEKMRKESDVKERRKLYGEIARIMQDEVPAVFLYSPDFVYILPKKIKGDNINLISTPSERFSDIYNWYIETNRIWNIFVK